VAEIGHWEGDTNGSSKTVPIENTIRSTVTSSDKQVKESGFLEKAWESFRAEWHDGSAFATFRVDHTGSVDESFSSSTGESDLAATFNSTSAQIRAAKNSLAGGNLAGDNLLGAGVGAAGIGAFTSVTGAEADGTVGADPDATGASTVFLLSLCAASTTSVIIITTRGPMVKYAGIVVPNSDNISIQ
jgi:hypothetical protein